MKALLRDSVMRTDSLAAHSVQMHVEKGTALLLQLRTPYSVVASSMQMGRGKVAQCCTPSTEPISSGRQSGQHYCTSALDIRRKLSVTTWPE
jgi:hypothetical protein